MSKFYTPSGKFSTSSIFYFVILSLLVFPVLGLIYAYCIWYIPFIYINFLIAAGFGFVIGLLLNRFVTGKGKVRNVGLSTVFGVLGGLVALYFHWSVWVDLVFNAGESYGNSRIGVTVSNVDFLQVFGLALDPSSLLNLIFDINEVGTWGIRTATVSGVFLSIIWLIEAVIIIGIPVLMQASRAKEPFSEKGDEWFDSEELRPINYIENTDDMIAALSNSIVAEIESLTVAENLDADHSIFVLYSSKHEDSYLSIENRKAKSGKDDKIEFDVDHFVEYIKIDKLLKDKLLSIS